MTVATEDDDTFDTEQALLDLRSAATALALLTTGLLPQRVPLRVDLSPRDVEALDWLAREVRDQVGILDDAFHDQRLDVQRHAAAGVS